jgi:hypothetical protein
MHQASHLELHAAGLIHRYRTTVSIQYSDSGLISGNSAVALFSRHCHLVIALCKPHQLSATDRIGEAVGQREAFLSAGFPARRGSQAALRCCSGSPSPGMIPARDFRCDGHLRDRRNLVNVANPRPKKQHCSPAAGNGGSGDWRESVLQIGSGLARTRRGTPSTANSRSGPIAGTVV